MAANENFLVSSLYNLDPVFADGSELLQVSSVQFYLSAVQVLLSHCTMGNGASEPAVGQRSPDNDTKNPEVIEGMARVMTTAKERRTANRNVFTREEQEEEEEEYNYKESAVILTQLFKKMDPAVMKSIGDVMGELKVSIKYKSDQSLLLVKVVGARDLSPKDLRGKVANAFVQVDLVPDPAGSGIKHTNVVKKSLNPTFNEIFAFPCSAGILAETKLRLTVWNHDTLGAGDFMGERIVELRELEPNQVLTNWYPLQEEMYGGRRKVLGSESSPPPACVPTLLPADNRQ
uniref:C2 domain-containing protein n=1 Tax=Branchiostoma floridae TaxID=7739 RepID=C3YVH2_BRAFL|eukprot:XP_002599683.1 hypothetical protein BRAFLDRAFT_70360 [Branchiostoma floridae]